MKANEIRQRISDLFSTLFGYMTLKETIITILSLPFIVVLGPIVGALITIGIDDGEEKITLKKKLMIFISICSVLMLIGLAGHYKSARDAIDVRFESVAREWNTLHQNINRVRAKNKTLRRSLLSLNKELIDSVDGKAAEIESYGEDLKDSSASPMYKFKAEVIDVGGNRPMIFITTKNESSSVINEVTIKIDVLNKTGGHIYTIIQDIKDIDIRPGKTKRLTTKDNHSLYQYVRERGGPKKILGVDDYSDMTIKADIIAVKSSPLPLKIPQREVKNDQLDKRLYKYRFKHSYSGSSKLKQPLESELEKKSNRMMVTFDNRFMTSVENNVAMTEKEKEYLNEKAAKHKILLLEAKAKHEYDMMTARMRKELVITNAYTRRDEALINAYITKINSGESYTGTAVEIRTRIAEKEVAEIKAEINKEVKVGRELDKAMEAAIKETEEKLAAIKVKVMQEDNERLAEALVLAAKASAGTKQMGPDMVEVDTVIWETEDNSARHVIRIKNISPFIITQITTESIIMDKDKVQIDKALEVHKELNINPGESYEAHTTFRQMDHYKFIKARATDIVMLRDWKN